MSKKINATTLISTLLLFFSFIGVETAFSQDSVFNSSKPVLLHGSLLYDFPQSFGITAGLTYPFRSIIKNRIFKNGSVFTKQKDKFWGIETAFYRYPYNYTGILLIPTIGSRHYVHQSFFYETSLGIGVFRTFYDGKVYEVDASGNVQEKPLFGRFYATTHLSSAFNFLVQKSGGKIVALQVKPSVWFQYPYESFIKPHVSLEAGITYQMGKRNIKTRNIIKHLRK